MIVELTELIDRLESGSRPKGGVKNGSTGIPSLGAEHLNSEGGFTFKKIKFIPEDFFKNQKKGLINKDDILIVKDGATTGKVSYVNDAFPYENASINEHVFKISLNKNRAIPKYVFWHLFSQIGRNQILEDFRGATVGGISRGFTKNVKFPLPSLEEQKRIVRILNQADSLRQKRQKAMSLLDDYLKAVFLEMFGDPISNPKRIRTTKIKGLGDVVTGSTPSRKVSENYGDFIEWIKSDNINNHHHYLTKATEHLSEKGLQKGRSVPAGSILVTCIAGSLSCIGNVSMADRKVAFNQQINAIVPKPGIEPNFLYSQILFGKKKFRQASTNSMKGMLSKSNFSEIEMMNPDEDLQKEYSRVFDRTYNLKQKMLRQNKELETQFHALVQGAFNQS